MATMAFVRATAAAVVLVGITGCVGGSAWSGDDEPSAKHAAAPARGKAETPSAFVDPAKLRIVEGKGWIDDKQGFLKIAGKVKNDTGRWITSVRVTIRLYDASGKEIRTDSITTEVAKDMGEEAVESVYSERTFVPPGETAVFYFTRDAAKIRGAYASHKLAVRARIAENPPSMALSGFAADRQADGSYAFRGSIENRGSVGCRTPRAVIGFYGADGKLVAASTETPDATFQKVLAPGRSIEVPRRAYEPSGLPVTRVQGFADCDVP